MHIDTPYKILDVKPSDELLDYNFDSLTFIKGMSNFDPIGFPKITFGELELFGILRLPSFMWKEPHKNVPLKVNETHEIFPIIQKEIKKLEELYDASAKVAVLDGLAPGAVIGRHFDSSPIFKNCHRVHLPLVTDTLVDFYIDDVKYHFKKGEFFEFNNQMYHEVHNKSNIFRIHLVVDLLPNLYQGPQ